MGKISINYMDDEGLGISATISDETECDDLIRTFAGILITMSYHPETVARCLKEVGEDLEPFKEPKPLIDDLDAYHTYCTQRRVYDDGHKE